jgi:predicted dehydrogenase
MDPVRIGVIGCGVIGPYHMEAAAASPLVDLVAVADRIGERAAEAAAKFNVPKTYREGSDLINDPEIEGVVLAFPAAGRCELALEAFGQGKHVLTEKPVALNADEVRRMIAARGDRIAACCSARYRFPEGAEKAAEIIASGLLGELREIYCRAFSAAGPPPQSPPPPWRLRKDMNGGGILTNWGCYDLDYLLGICGWNLTPKTVFAHAWSVPPIFAPNLDAGSDAETHLVAMIRCEEGPVIHYERGEYMAAHTESAWQIVGSQGSLTLHMTASNPKAIVLDEAIFEEGVVTTTVWEADEDIARVHGGPVIDFAAAIRGKHSPRTGLEQALVVAQITDAIYRSAEVGTSVEITDAAARPL